MITQEQFGQIVEQVAAGEGLTNEEAKELIQTLAELDQRGLVAESVVEFVLQTAEYVYNDVAEKILKEMSLRDHAKIKKILAIGSKAADQLKSITSLYVAQTYQQLRQDLEGGSAVADAEPSVLDDGDTA